MDNTNEFTKKVRKVGALMALIGFALGIAFGVLFALLIFQGLSFPQVLNTVMPIGAMGLFALVVGRRLRNYRRIVEEDDFLLGMPEEKEEEEEELDLYTPRKRRERTASYREQDDSTV